MKKCLMFLLIGMVFFHCKEITTTTQIYPDGSLARTVMVKSSSKNMNDSAFPIPTDSTWSIQTKMDDKDTSQYIYSAYKRFSDVRELNKDLEKQSKNVRVTVRVEKQFRWFHTRIRYEETYGAVNPYHRTPISRFMTEAELAQWEQAPDSLKLYEEKYNQWETANLVEEFLLRFERAVDSLRLEDVRQSLVGNRDRLAKALLDTANTHDNDKLTATCVQVLGIPASRLVKVEIDSIVAGIELRSAYAGEVSSNHYVNKVILPGRIIAGNSLKGNGQELSWEINPKQFYFHDYVMTAAGETKNNGIVVLSLLLGVIAIVGLIAPYIARRRRG